MLITNFRPHRTSLRAGTAEPQKVFVMLDLLPETTVPGTRQPLAYALVVDTSASMRERADPPDDRNEIKRRGLPPVGHAKRDGGSDSNDRKRPTKLDRAIDAVRTLIDDQRLAASDRVAVIQFDSDASALLSLSAIGDRRSAHDAANRLYEHSGGTHMGSGMGAALQALGELPPEVTKRVFLLTDGQTNDECECRGLADQLGATNAPVVAIGVGDEYNEELLLDVAQRSNGRPYHLQQMAQLASILDRELVTSLQEVETDIQARLAMVRGASLESVTRVYPSLAWVSTTGQPFRLGNLAAGDATVLIFEFTIAGLARPPSRVRVAQFTLTGNLPALGRSGEVLLDLFLTFTSDEAAVASVDAEVLSYVQQRNLDHMVQEAVQQAGHDPGRARQTLQVAVGMTQSLGNDAMTRSLSRALDELSRTGTISANTVRAVRVGGRTQTVKAGGTSAATGAPSDDEIRRLTGT